jgi:polyisoprenoid-binding protein YceI
MKRLLLPALLALTMVGPAAAATYEIDGRHTQVEFTYTHFGLSHISARLNQVTGTFDFDPKNPAKSAIDVQLPMSSLSTGVPRLDSHLASADFFDVANFPNASFKSNAVKVLGKDRLSVSGDLTIHGVTRPVVFEVNIVGQGEHPARKTPAVGLDASTTIKRSDFGVGGFPQAVADEVRLHINMEAAQPKPLEAAPAAAPTPAPAAH